MIKEIAQRVVGAAIVSFWVVVVTATLGAKGFNAAVKLALVQLVFAAR